MDEPLNLNLDKDKMRELIQSPKSVAKRVELWMAALMEFRATFHVTIEQLQELSAINNDMTSYDELTDEEKMFQQIMNEKIELVKIIHERLPRISAMVFKPKKIIV